MRVRNRAWARIAAGACLLFAAAAFAQGQTPATAATEQRDGTFKTVQGDVTVVRGNVRSAAVVGGPLRISDRVLTGSASTAAIMLRDDTVLTIGPDSSVDLAEFHFDTEAQDGNLLISLWRGSLRVVTGLIAKLRPEQVKITTPTTVIGVRGTDFIVEQRP